MTVFWTEAAERDMRRLPKADARRIVEAILRYATTRHGDVKRLRGVGDPEYRLRVGQWRVRFVLDAGRGALRVRRVLHRSAAYRR